MNLKYAIKFINEYASIYNFEYLETKQKNKEIMDIQKDAVRYQSVELAYILAKKVIFADVEEMEKIVVQSNDPYWAFIFARDINGADVQKLQDVVVKSKLAGYCWQFLNSVKCKNTEPLREVINNSKNVELKNKLKHYLSNIENNYNNGHTF